MLFSEGSLVNKSVYMQEIKTLIDRASKVCGNDTILAQRMGIKNQVVSMLRHGRTISPETAAELASLAGESAREATIQAVIQRSAGTRRGEVLRRIFELEAQVQRQMERNNG